MRLRLWLINWYHIIDCHFHSNISNGCTFLCGLVYSLFITFWRVRHFDSNNIMLYFWPPTTFLRSLYSMSLSGLSLSLFVISYHFFQTKFLYLNFYHHESWVWYLYIACHYMAFSITLCIKLSLFSTLFSNKILIPQIFIIMNLEFHNCPQNIPNRVSQ